MKLGWSLSILLLQRSSKDFAARAVLWHGQASMEVVAGVPEQLSGTEDIAVEPHCEWGRFLLVTAEDEAQGCE